MEKEGGKLCVSSIFEDKLKRTKVKTSALWAEVSWISLHKVLLDLVVPSLCLLADHSSSYQQERRLQQE